jgi:5-methylcytosine-specific restriction endonuclease McrA
MLKLYHGFYLAKKYFNKYFMKNQKARIPLNLRKRVIDRDGIHCVYCDEDLSESEIHMDHVIPESQGGETSYSNLQVTCRKCNLAKGVLSESEFTKRLVTRATNILNRIGISI